MSNIIWKRFTLNYLFTFDSSNQLPFTKKQLDVSDYKDDTYNIAVVTQSEKNNGISGYVERNSIDENKIMKNVMIYSLNFGTCFYQSDAFVLLDTHGSIFRLIAKEYGLRKILEDDMIVGNFFAKMIMKICKNGIYNYNWKPNSQRAGLEYILLPCIEVKENDEYIWEENGHYYTLAVEYISYIYLDGRVRHNQKLIDNYTYHY